METPFLLGSESCGYGNSILAGEQRVMAMIRRGLSCPDLYGSVPGSIAEKAYPESLAGCSSSDTGKNYFSFKMALGNNFSKPLWDVIAHMVSNIPLPTPGKDRVLFAIENSLLAAEVPPKDGLPHADVGPDIHISFQPLMQCLDVDNFIKIFSFNACIRSHMPFNLSFSVADYIDAPTPYMMGLHSGVDTSDLTMDGLLASGDKNVPWNPGLQDSEVEPMGVFLGRVYEVVVVDLEHNRITTSEDIPTIPEPEYSYLRYEIMKLLYPNVVGIDLMKGTPGSSSEQCPSGSKPWGQNHDMHLRFIFLKFFASLLGGYRNFIENTATHVFNNQAFLKKRSRSTNQPPDPMITQFIESQGFLDYLERGLGSEENSNNLLDKLQDAIGRGQNPMSVLPSDSPEPEIITISDTSAGISGSGAKYSYDRFPSNIRTEEQEVKRKQILAAATGALEYSAKHTPTSPSVLVGKDSKAESLSPRERAAERERMVLDIKVKLQGLWLRLLKLGATDDPLSSFEYGTILALIESDAEGIGGSGFVECIREHIHSGWICQLTEEQFIAVKELLKTAITRATSRNDMTTVRDALEVSAEMYKKDMNNVSDYVQRHLRSLSIWEELRYRLIAGLGLPDTDAWYMIETIAGKNNIGYKHLIKLRGFLSHIQQLCVGYWGIYSLKSQSLSSYGLPSPHSQDAKDDSQQPAEASGVGRSWVQSMFSRDTTSRANSFGRVRKWTSDSGTLTANENGTPRKLELANAGQKKMQTNVRTLRGHSGAVTALHCVTRREVWDLVGDREDAGFFISGSTDCSVKIWDPSIRGSELRATLKGHTRTVRAISSDRVKIVSGSDDKFVLVWDKQTTQLLEELKGHDAQVSCVRMLSGERVLTAAHDGTVKMWDVRTDTCVATVGRCSNAVLCMEYDDSTGILAAGGRDAYVQVMGCSDFGKMRT
ncbi:hypothetical protein RJ639_008644, partial [Escallonia herrerae]